LPVQNKGYISFLTFSIFQGLPLKAAVSCRKGGVSRPPFTSLNMGLHVGDRVEDVLENRKRYCRALGLDEGLLINCRQVHGTHIEEVSEEDRGRGAFSLDTAIPDTDGLITSSPDVPLTMNYADCTPLFFYDPVRKVCALSHGGWDCRRHSRENGITDGGEISFKKGRYIRRHWPGHRTYGF